MVSPASFMRASVPPAERRCTSPMRSPTRAPTSARDVAATAAVRSRGLMIITKHRNNRCSIPCQALVDFVKCRNRFPLSQAIPRLRLLALRAFSRRDSMKLSRLFQALGIAGLALALSTPARAAEDKPAPAAGGTTATFWGHAAWVITTPGGAIIAIDPWLDKPIAPKLDKPPKLDAIPLTHGHFDHPAGAADLAKKTGAKIGAALELTPPLGA